MNQTVYWSLVKDITQPPISIRSWDSLFEENDWSKIFKIPYNVTFDSRIQSFQYKILLRIFPCNRYVSKFDRSVSEDCQFCNEGTDDICHFFFDCNMCAHFWGEMRSWIADNLNILNPSQETLKKKVILGSCIDSEHYYAINFIILYAKWFIFIKKKNSVHYLNFTEFINLLRCKLNIHLIVARRQNSRHVNSRMNTLSVALGLS